MGDGNFKWWTGYAEDAEIFSGPYDTREEAIAVGREEYDEEFYVVEADKSVMRPSINTEWAADRIMEDLCENNEECFGEDGPEDPWGHDETAYADLERAIDAAVTEWLKAHPGRTFCFGDMRNGEYVKPTVEA